MARQNQFLIEQYKEIARMKQTIRELTERDTAEIYACIALCLSDKKYGWSPDQIQDFIQDTGYLWTECVNNQTNMVEWCKSVTGIDIVQATVAPANETNE